MASVSSQRIVDSYIDAKRNERLSTQYFQENTPHINHTTLYVQVTPNKNYLKMLLFPPQNIPSQQVQSNESLIYFSLNQVTLVFLFPIFRKKLKIPPLCNLHFHFLHCPEDSSCFKNHVCFLRCFRAFVITTKLKQSA